MKCDRNKGKGVCWQEWRDLRFTADLPTSINSINLNNDIDLFCKTQKKVNFEKKDVSCFPAIT